MSFLVFNLHPFKYITSFWVVWRDSAGGQRADHIPLMAAPLQASWQFIGPRTPLIAKSKTRAAGSLAPTDQAVFVTDITQHVFALKCNGATTVFLQVSQMCMLHDKGLMWVQGVRMFITLLNVLKQGSGIKSPWSYPLTTHHSQIKTRIKH